MGLLSRIFRPSAAKAAEGQSRPGPWYLPITGGWLPADVGKNWNYWQLGYDSVVSGPTAMVEACGSAYSQTIAMCPGDHWRTNDNGGRERVRNSALSRILRKPNGYQSISDFMLNLGRSLYLNGNTYALALRNDRFEIAELHLMDARQSCAHVAVDGSIFYSLGGNEIVERMIDGPLVVPARDVLHVRLHTPRHPLIGESPLVAAAMQMAAGNAALQQQIAFFSNQSRPSFVLSTDVVLTKEQTEQLRERWNEQSQGLNTGGTPILGGGIKPYPISQTAEASQLVEILKLNDQAVANVFRIPLQVLGIGDTPYASTEMLMQSWIASGLGFALNHIEEAFGRLFNLRGLPEEYVEFDTEALLRSALKDRIEALARGVQGGIYAPNEARFKEGLPAAENGDEPRVQQQVVPLSFGAQQPPAPVPALPPPSEPPDDAAAERAANDNDQLRRIFRASHGRTVAV